MLTQLELNNYRYINGGSFLLTVVGVEIGLLAYADYRGILLDSVAVGIGWGITPYVIGQGFLYGQRYYPDNQLIREMVNDNNLSNAILFTVSLFAGITAYHANIVTDIVRLNLGYFFS